MSEEKKTSWGKAYGGAVPQGQQSAAAPAPADDEPTDGRPANPSEGDQSGGRNKNALQGILGKQLRAAYGELLNAPVPDRINDLINKLKDAEDRQGAEKARDGEERN
jgi:hypothetical protein